MTTTTTTTEAAVTTTTDQNPFKAVLTEAGIPYFTVGTGGGCDALEVRLPETGGWFIWLTDDAQVPEDAEAMIVVGIYDADGDCYGYREVYLDGTVAAIRDLIENHEDEPVW